MKQLSIFCSGDLEAKVVSALDRAGVEGYLRLGEATGNKFLPPQEIPRTMVWQATVIVVPAVAPEKAEQIIEELQEYAGSCEVTPCLRIVQSAVERVV